LVELLFAAVEETLEARLARLTGVADPLPPFVLDLDLVAEEAGLRGLLLDEGVADRLVDSGVLCLECELDFREGRPGARGVSSPVPWSFGGARFLRVLLPDMFISNNCT